MAEFGFWQACDVLEMLGQVGCNSTEERMLDVDTINMLFVSRTGISLQGMS